MPVVIRAPLRPISQEEFGQVSFEVMRVVFEIHNELGRFFDEKIYKQELAYRFPETKLEEPIDVVFDSFHKRYFLDVLIGPGSVFEFKAVDMLAGRHQAQLLNYLMLCELNHGKLINVRAEEVEHRFVNSHWTRASRMDFNVDAERWNGSITGAMHLQELLMAMLHDVGTGLELSLYEEAVTHFWGGAAQVETDVDVCIGPRCIGKQRVHMIAPGVALKITGLDGRLDRFETHARRLLSHLDLNAIAWVNIAMKTVTFTTLTQ